MHIRLMPIRVLSPAVLLAAVLHVAACSRTVRAPDAPEPDVAARIARIEQGLLPTTRVSGRTYTPVSIEERMRALGVPAVSVAVINDGRIEWAKAYGLADVDAHRPATTSTLFQAASISKPVAAMAALRLVQEGRLALDEDVNARLRSWRLPGNGLTAKHPVTLRLIMTHAAGTTVHGFPGYAPGKPVPTVPQLLDGAKPANTAAVRVDIEPGTRWRYSGGGTTIMQLLMTDATGEPFPSLMRRLVLAPVGMTASTYEQPLPASRAIEAATGYRANGRAVEGRYHTYPEMAAAGLWTTPTDLARLAIEIQRSLAGTSNKLLSREMTAAMLKRGVGGHGLGPSVDFEGDSLRFGHGGANEGFRAMWTGFATRGQGAVVMTNSDDGMAIAGDILQAIGREYGWPASAPRMITPLAVASETMRDYAGRYQLPSSEFQVNIALDDGRLMARRPGAVPFELVPTQANVFAPTIDAPPFVFERDSSGAVTTLVVGGTRLVRAR
jgi:CubicO group peptidase (beta-lactamase class C family)